jgi:hypothetical protein
LRFEDFCEGKKIRLVSGTELKLASNEPLASEFMWQQIKKWFRFVRRDIAGRVARFFLAQHSKAGTNIPN